jgi:peptidoglycan hydrolase CwlO-like protein
MKAHEKLALVIKEQREVILALQREKGGGIEKRREDLLNQIAVLQKRVDNLDTEFANIDNALHHAQQTLDDLLHQRAVMHTPELKLLLKLAKKFSEEK